LGRKLGGGGGGDDDDDNDNNDNRQGACYGEMRNVF
jgi:hypothetical protein